MQKTTNHIKQTKTRKKQKQKQKQKKKNKTNSSLKSLIRFQSNNRTNICSEPKG